MQFLRRLFGQLPESWQREAKKYRHRRQIQRGRFDSPEPEYAELERWVGSGDWVIDVGANIGHYSHRLSGLVGGEGRVFAFEPVPETFALLASNVLLFPHQNVTLLNLAASDSSRVTRMSLPPSRFGTPNYYQAQIAPEGGIAAYCAPLDAIPFASRISLLKVDAEGHDPAVVRGALRLIENDRPVLIVESGADGVAHLLGPLGYLVQRLPGSPNHLFLPEQ